MLCLVVAFGVVFLVSMLWTASGGAPWVPTPMSAIHKVLTMAEVGPADVVYDLGNGDGRMIIAVARCCGARGGGGGDHNELTFPGLRLIQGDEEAGIYLYDPGRPSSKANPLEHRRLRRAAPT